MRAFLTLITVAVVTTTLAADVSTSQRRRIEDAATVLKEIHAVPDKDIPAELWNKAACVIVVPSLKKAAFVIGGEYGKGLMSCRRDNTWSAPIFMQVGKGSWGFQIGAQTIDLDLGTSGQFSGLTQFGNPASVVAEFQDGYGAGELTNLEVQADGSIEGFYGNGQTQTLGSFGVATFANDGGLEEVGDSYFRTTANSGARVLGRLEP